MPNSIRADQRHVAEHAREHVHVLTARDVKRLAAIRAGLGALIAGLAALAGAASGDDVITLHGWLTAAASAAAAAGAVYGVGNGGRATTTDIPRNDLARLAENGRDQR